MSLFPASEMLAPLLSDVDKANLKKYQYRGGDNSYIYKYLLSPLAQSIADVTPRWVAPNLITLTGLNFTFLAFLLTLIFNPSLGPDCPRWLSFTTALCIFIYQTLDNVDGKQARRTGSSSPLGMLFDHGCDALNAGISSIAISSSAGTSWSVSIFFCLFCGFVPFYFQTWEESYLDEMYLPLFNGPTEGLLVAMSCCLLSAFHGSYFWHQPIKSEHTLGFILPYLDVLFAENHGSNNNSSISARIYESPLLSTKAESIIATEQRISFSLPVLGTLSPGQATPFRLICFFAGVTVSATVFSHTNKVLSFIIKDTYNCGNVFVGTLHAAFRIGKAFLDLLPILLFFPASFLWCLNSPIALPKYAVITVLTMTCVFVEIVTHIMLTHVCRGKVKPMQRYIVVPMVFLALSVTSFSVHPFSVPKSFLALDTQSIESAAGYTIAAWNVFDNSPATASIWSCRIDISPAFPKFYEESILLAYGLLAFIVTCIKSYQMCTECAEALDIYVFRIGSRPSGKLKSE